MKKKYNNFLTIFIILLMAISGLLFIIPLTNADVIVDDSLTGDLYYGSASRSSNGTLFSLNSGLGDAGRYLNLNISYDNGVTWNGTRVHTDAGDSLRYSVVAVDNDNNVHVAYADTSSGAGAAEIRYKKYNLKGEEQVSTNLASVTTYTITGVDMVIDYDDNIHIVYSYYHAAVTGHVAYKKYTTSIDSWSSTIYVTAGSNVKGAVDAKIEVDYNLYGCTPHVFYNNLTSGYLVMRLGSTWDTEYNIKSCTSVITKYDIAYSKEQNKIIVFYDNPDDNTMEWSYINIVNYVVTDKGIIYDGGIHSQLYPVISITYYDVIHFIWSGSSVDTATSKVRHRSYNLITGSYVTENTYLTTGGDDHKIPYVVNTMYPDFCKLTDNYLMLYYNDTDNNVIFYNDVSPIWVGASDPYEDFNLTFANCVEILPSQFWPHGNYIDFPNVGLATLGTPNGYKCFSTRYKSKITGLLKSVDIWIDKERWAEKSYIVNDFSLYVNGDSVGIPDYFIDDNEDDYKLRWIFNVIITDEYPLFQFRCNKPGWYGIHLNYNTKTSTNIFESTMTNVDGYCCNNIFGYPYPLGNSPYGYTLKRYVYNPKIHFCYISTDVYNPLEDTPYIIKTDKTDYYLPDDNNVIIEWSMPTSTGILKLFRNDVEVTTDSFPKIIRSFTGSSLYIPYIAGTYNLSLRINDIEQDASTFIVNSYPSGDTVLNMMITTYPNPSMGDNSYIVKYRYNGSTDGLISYGYNANGVDAVAFKYFNHSSGSLITDTFTMFREFGDTEIYWFLLSGYGSSFTNVDTHKHTFIDNLGLPILKICIYSLIDSERSEYSSLHGYFEQYKTYLSEGDSVTNNIFISNYILATGTHPYIGGNTQIFVNANQVANVNTIYDVDISNWIKEPRSYNITLRYNNTVVSYFNLIVLKGDIVSDAETNIVGLIQNAFPDLTVRTIIGMAICLIITFLPFLISLQLKQRHVTINIPNILYGITFGIGVVVSYILGFFIFEVLFFLCFMLVSILALYWFQGHRSGSPEA